MSTIPIWPEGITKEEYWLVKTDAIEWVYVIIELMKTTKDKVTEADQANGMVPADGGGYIYMLKKSFYPIEAIHKSTGVSVEELAKGKMLTLHGPAAEGLPKATVEYWGTA